MERRSTAAWYFLSLSVSSEIAQYKSKCCLKSCHSSTLFSSYSGGGGGFTFSGGFGCSAIFLYYWTPAPLVLYFSADSVVQCLFWDSARPYHFFLGGAISGFFVCFFFFFLSSIYFTFTFFEKITWCLINSLSTNYSLHKSHLYIKQIMW